MENPKSPFYSFCPYLVNLVGHHSAYNLSVQQAVRPWKNPVSLISQRATVSFPRNWLKVLPADYYVLQRFHFPGKILFLLKNLIFFFRFFKKVKNKNATFLIESYTLCVLGPLALAAWMARPKGKFFNLVRYAPEDLKANGKIVFFLHWILELSFGKKQTLLLSDSEKIAENVTACFHRKVHVLPIPHGKNDKTVAISKREKKSLVCWWPGGPRKEKGLAILEALAPHLPPAFSFLVSAELKDNPHFQQGAVAFVPAELQREEYEEMFQYADAILLPYDPTLYSARTSGIFVEAVISGALPLVTDGTWMAHELRKFDLVELLIDWTPSKAPAQIAHLVSSQAVREKLKIMQQAYEKFHCLDHFSKVFGELLC